MTTVPLVITSLRVGVAGGRKGERVCVGRMCVVGGDRKDVRYGRRRRGCVWWEVGRVCVGVG